MKGFNMISQAAPASFSEESVRFGKRIFYSAPQLKDNLASDIFIENKNYNYNSNFAEEERQRRLAEFQKRKELVNKKRETRVLQEAGRWQTENEEYKKSLEKLEIKRNLWKAGQKNLPSEPFNFITLDYDNSEWRVS